MDEVDPLHQKLTNIAADLLSSSRFNDPFLRRLFETPAGVWRTVAACCAGAEMLPGFAAEAFVDHAERFVVTYLPWPGVPLDDPYCMILFVHDDNLWSTVALFNRACLRTP